MTNLFTHQTKSAPTLLSNMQEISKLSEDILKKEVLKMNMLQKKMLPGVKFFKIQKILN